MILYPEDWMPLADGRRYQGELDETTQLPHGLGIIPIDDNNFYAGEFKQGKRCGRGFIINHEITRLQEKVWVNGSYEEVMATAEFDSCGRVIHTERVGHEVNRMVVHHHWHKLQDGMWEDDAFVSPANLSPLQQSPWKWAETNYTSTDYYDNLPSGYRRTYNNTIRKAGKDGSYSFNGNAFVTVYDEYHLLFCDRYGHVFRLADNEEYHYDVMLDNNTIKERRTFSLHIAEPDYQMLFENNSFDEIIANALGISKNMSIRARIYFLRIFYHRNNIFRLSEESVKAIKNAANYGNIYAQFAYGRYHVVVKPSPQSTAISLQLFTEAHEKGLPDATAALAEAWRYGDFTMVNHEKADQMLSEALQKQSEYAAVLSLKELIFGTVIKDCNAQEALQMAEQQLYGEANHSNHTGVWLYYRALALDMLDKKQKACDFFTHAVNSGVLCAWVELAYANGGIDDNGQIADREAFIETLRDGTRHGDADSRSILALNDVIEFDKLPTDEQKEKPAREISRELEESYRQGSRMAAEYLGDIHYNGSCLQPRDMEKAWEWYSKAAKWDLPSAYEKLYDMVYYHDKDLDLHEHDMLALCGTRLGSRHLLEHTVIIHTQGRLEDYAQEIETYYDPIFDAEPDNSDEESPEPPDDDGRFDAWA